MLRCALAVRKKPGINNGRGEIMKSGIHPDYKPTVVKCACGATFETASTRDNLRVDICSNCHPFFTGKQKLVDTGGRVDRFKKKYNITD